jgi:hypothetical protein
MPEKKSLVVIIERRNFKWTLPFTGLKTLNPAGRA